MAEDNAIVIGRYVPDVEPADGNNVIVIGPYPPDMEPLETGISIGYRAGVNMTGIAMGARASAVNGAIAIGHGVTAEDGEVSIGKSGMKMILCGEDIFARMEMLERRVKQMEKCLNVLWYTPGVGPGAMEAAELFAEHSSQQK